MIQWYLYDFDSNITNQEKEFFGYNNGMPMTNPNSSGILVSKENIIQTKCEQNQKLTPYFVKNPVRLLIMF